jgi:hypothetical protein
MYSLRIVQSQFQMGESGGHFPPSQLPICFQSNREDVEPLKGPSLCLELC